MCSYVVVISDARIALCLLEAERDRDLFVQYMNDAHATRNLNSRLPISRHQEQEWFEKLYTSPYNVVFGVVARDKAEQPLIGSMGIHHIDRINDTATTGTFIFPPYQGNRYAPHAKMLLLNYAFNHLNLERIQSRVFSSNVASIKANERCGYREVGRLPNWRKRGAVYEDEVILTVERSHWEPLWEEFSPHHDITRI